MGVDQLARKLVIFVTLHNDLGEVDTERVLVFHRIVDRPLSCFKIVLGHREDSDDQVRL